MNIFSFYNQNRRLIWVAILAVIVFIMLLKGLNSIIAFSTKRQAEENEKIRINMLEEKRIKENLPLTEESIKKNEKLIIDVFIDYCNSNKIEKAYSLLSDNCKKELFESLDIFKLKYFDVYFKTKKTYSKELIRGNTYKIKFYEDVLTSGRINEEFIQDNYTIETQKNGDIRLNIKLYVGGFDINETYSNDKIQITVAKKHVYDEYEEYEMKVQNLTDKNIALDTMQYPGTMFVEGDGLKESYLPTYDVSLHNLIIKAKTERNIRIRYDKPYIINKEVKVIVFSDVVYDYDLKKPAKEQNDRNTIRIGI